MTAFVGISLLALFVASIFIALNLLALKAKVDALWGMVKDLQQRRIH